MMTIHTWPSLLLPLHAAMPCCPWLDLFLAVGTINKHIGLLSMKTSSSIPRYLKLTTVHDGKRQILRSSFLEYVVVLGGTLCIFEQKNNLWLTSRENLYFLRHTS